MKNLPKELLTNLKHLPGFDEQAFIDVHQSEKRITSIRLNPFKPVELDFKVDEPVSWCNNAFYISERPNFTHDPLFHAGCYYVQEAGSMFLEHALKSVLDLSQPLKVLDLCAAPGGKSTLISSLLNNESLLIANEVVKQRADILTQNLSKWGTNNTIVTNNDPQKFSKLESFFDAIVIDAPCSGSGLFRKQPDAIDEWSTDNVNLCSSRQKRIVADVLPSLKEQGYIIYSTCSYSEQENEDVVKWLEKEFNLEHIPISINKNSQIIEAEKGYRFYPNKVKSEGFYCAVLRKNDGKNVKNYSKSSTFKLSKAELEIFETFLVSKSGVFIKNATNYHFVAEAVQSFMVTHAKDFYLKKAGVCVGEIKGKDLVPHQELAWSINVLEQKKLELNKLQALKYLKKELFDAGSQKTGFSLISYKEQGLGWAKILPNRVNNYLANELRILN